MPGKAGDEGVPVTGAAFALLFLLHDAASDVPVGFHHDGIDGLIRLAPRGMEQARDIGEERIRVPGNLFAHFSPPFFFVLARGNFPTSASRSFSRSASPCASSSSRRRVTKRSYSASA